MGDLKDKRIAALGLSYKPDIDDLRESPAVEVCRLLVEAGACVTAYEPFRPYAKFDGFETVSTLETALATADAILLLVGHSEFRNSATVSFLSQTPARVVIDAVNGWHLDTWEKTGFRVLHLGMGQCIIN
jgi:UDP-N-acetyl-D-mannosaminuronate dehydrogenase